MPRRADEGGKQQEDGRPGGRPPAGARIGPSSVVYATRVHPACRPVVLPEQHHPVYTRRHCSAQSLFSCSGDLQSGDEGRSVPRGTGRNSREPRFCRWDGHPEVPLRAARRLPEEPPTRFTVGQLFGIEARLKDRRRRVGPGSRRLKEPTDADPGRSVPYTARTPRDAGQPPYTRPPGMPSRHPAQPCVHSVDHGWAMYTPSVMPDVRFSRPSDGERHLCAELMFPVLPAISGAESPAQSGVMSRPALLCAEWSRPCYTPLV